MSDIGEQIERGSDGPEWEPMSSIVVKTPEDLFALLRQSRLAALREVREMVKRIDTREKRVPSVQRGMESMRNTIASYIDAMIAKESKP